MKIEMGESLFYSWLRHVKECQIVQTNWKTSNQWELQNEDEINKLFIAADKFFFEKYQYKIFKQNSSLSQVLQQCECDAVGVSIGENQNIYYAIDVAFHGAGLNYGTKDETIMKVIAKGIKTAMCLYGYMNSNDSEIIFASPKINKAILDVLLPCVDEANVIFSELGFDFKMRIIANDDFNDTVLQPILLVSGGIADTSELFIRSYQMFSMFDNGDKPVRVSTTSVSSTASKTVAIDYKDDSIYKELKVGKIANVVLRKMLEDGLATKEEIKFLQTANYSKQFFDLQYPVLIKTNSSKKEFRYYKDLLHINGETYRLCSEWFETNANNDRPYLLKWIEEHSK